ncbi:hypothetical protein THAR02_10054 [Trichoderma harzianum]|uniref:Uncharacterized protein n=1 Tax=Trichoderma harzianum TaxID=5544 RepID=A0A0F9XAU6_TRIHA|nr:hypothetical protein THAR02_10054 [Trichoderma harzianum]
MAMAGMGEMAIESRLRSRPRRICASREQVESSRVEADRIRSDQDEMATKSPQDMVRESALLQAGGARWADSNANEHATNVAGGKQARRARWAGDVQQIAGGGGKGRLSSTGVSSGGNWGGGLAQPHAPSTSGIRQLLGELDAPEACRRSPKQTWKWKRSAGSSSTSNARHQTGGNETVACTPYLLLMDPQIETSPVRHAPSLQLSAMHAARYSYPGQPQTAGRMLRTRYLRALELVAGH